MEICKAYQCSFSISVECKLNGRNEVGRAFNIFQKHTEEVPPPRKRKLERVISLGSRWIFKYNDN